MFVLDDESLSLCSDNCYSVVAVTLFLFVAVLICISLLSFLTTVSYMYVYMHRVCPCSLIRVFLMCSLIRAS